jgi:hypothetical protein
VVKFTTLIPVTRNDGSPVDAVELQAILQRFWLTFGACTVDGRTQGYWVDAGQLYQDECLKIVVACDTGRLPEAEDLVREVGRELGQLAMYFEVDRTSEVRILRIEEPL